MVNRKQFKGQGSTLHVAHRTSHSGFTIVELLVSILLTSIIMTAVYSVYRVQTHSAKTQESRLEAQEYARSVLDMMVREVRNAGYNPLTATNGANCAGGAAGAPSVVTATASSIRFTYDFQDTAGTVSTPDGLCNGPDEDITYTYTTGCGAGLGDVTRNGSGNPLTNCNVTSFTLSYFKQDGTALTSLPLSAADLLTVQRVNITLTVKSLKPDTEFDVHGQLTVTMTSNADLRNRGLPS